MTWKNACLGNKRDGNVIMDNTVMGMLILGLHASVFLSIARMRKKIVNF